MTETMAPWREERDLFNSSSAAYWLWEFGHHGNAKKLSFLNYKMDLTIPIYKHYYEEFVCRVYAITKTKSASCGKESFTFITFFSPSR